jgi:hypothetical protein
VSGGESREKKMGTFLICPLRGQKGTNLLQVRPLLLANEECPHFLFPTFPA